MTHAHPPRPPEGQRQGGNGHFKEHTDQLAQCLFAGALSFFLEQTWAQVNIKLPGGRVVQRTELGFYEQTDLCSGLKDSRDVTSQLVLSLFLHDKGAIIPPCRVKVGG